MASRTYYDLLEITIDSSAQEISKAYRTKALKLHPDKNRHDPSSASKLSIDQKFHELSEAYAVLSDEKAKVLYDAKIRIEIEKRKKDSMLDAHRRAMRDSLLARESAAKQHRMKTAAQEEQDEKDIQAKFQAELERIRKKQKWQHANVAFFQKYAPEEMDELPTASPPPSTLDSEELSMRSLKLKWLKTQAIDRDALERTFGRYGALETIIVSSKNDGSAVILCESHETAMSIMSDQKSHWRQLYSVSWAKEVSSSSKTPMSMPTASTSTLSRGQAHSASPLTQSKAPFASTPLTFKSTPSVNHQIPFEAYEERTLQRLREQQELKRQQEQNVYP